MGKSVAFSGRGPSVPRASGGAGPYPGATFLGLWARCAAAGLAGVGKGVVSPAAPRSVRG